MDLSSFERLSDRHRQIRAVISPPRCCSTTVARVFWEHPSIRYYGHEPFEETYYDGAGLDSALTNLLRPLDLDGVAKKPKSPLANDLLVKEMPYQVGDRFELLASLSTQPVVFLIRDPRLNISSRMAKKVEGGESPDYPPLESGWELLASQVSYCREQGLPYVIVDATDCRRTPEIVFERLFAEVGLSFSAEMLNWNSVPELELDNLGGRHDHLYRRVVASRGVLPPTEEMPPIESFPKTNGWRTHVTQCLAIYAHLGSDTRKVSPESVVVS